jgi:orotate phosphoribosyltransferase
MRAYKTEFIELALEIGVLQFGEFKLKSGRISPYFFNAGLFNTGYAVAKLGRYYSAAAADLEFEFDMLFGPAYKGIPLVTLTASALAEHYDIDVPFAFDRKEAKSHGEGGSVIGAPLSGRVLIVDDVITAGTAIRQTVALLRQQGAEPAGVLISLDRQERGTGAMSAVQEVQQAIGIPVASIVALDDLVTHLEDNAEFDGHRLAIEQYRKEFGI